MLEIIHWFLGNGVAQVAVATLVGGVLVWLLVRLAKAVPWLPVPPVGADLKKRIIAIALAGIIALATEWGRVLETHGGFRWELVLIAILGAFTVATTAHTLTRPAQ